MENKKTRKSDFHKSRADFEFDVLMKSINLLINNNHVRNTSDLQKIREIRTIAEETELFKYWVQ